jgi:hypothetical protein
MNRYRIDYTISSGITNEVVHFDYVELLASDEDEASQAATTWVHEHDSHHDPRIDPLVEVVAVDEIDYDIHDADEFVCVVDADAIWLVQLHTADGEASDVAGFDTPQAAATMRDTIRKALRTYSGWY